MLRSQSDYGIHFSWEKKPEAEPGYALVQYSARFKLLSTSDNKPIGNMVIGLPIPHFSDTSVCVPENEENNVEILPYGGLKFTPHFEENHPPILSGGLSTAFDYLKDNWISDIELKEGVVFFRLAFTSSLVYPRDEIELEVWFKVPEENIGKLTLLDNAAPGSENLGFGVAAYCAQITGGTRRSWSPGVERLTGVEITVEIKTEGGTSLEKVACKYEHMSLPLWVPRGVIPLELVQS
jgi:hypothetical protein